MKKVYTNILVTLLALVPFAAGGQALPFTAVDYSPVSLAMGGVSAAGTADVANAAFGNPAAVAFSEKKCAVNASYVTWSPSQVKTDIINVAGTYRVNDKTGVSFAYSSGTYPEYEAFDLAGTSKGMFTPNQMYVGAGLSYALKPELAVGINLGYASNALSEKISYTAVSADIYVMYNAEKFQVAAGVSELGPKVTSESGEFSLPSAAKLGLDYHLLKSEEASMDIAVDASYYLAGASSLAVGAQYGIKDMLFIRAGYRYSGESVIPSFASAGIGIKLSGMSLNAAYLFASETLSGTMCIGIGYSF